MNTKDKIKTAFQKPSTAFYIVICKLFGRWMSDKLYLSILYRMSFRRKLDWEHPKTFSEKLQWLKLYNRKPEYTTMVDKAAVKNYVASVIGKEYIIPTLGIWDKPEEIEWDALPQRFVLKCTHDSHSAIIVKDKETINRAEAGKQLGEFLKCDYFENSREWPYKNVPHRIIAEEYIEPESDNKDLNDFKFYTFNGEPKLLYITSNRGSVNGLNEDFFDVEGNHVDIRQFGYENAPVTPSLPKNFDKMVNMARMLAQNTYHVRVDFYEIGDKVYFGELTFFDGGGFCPFNKPEYDQLLGDWIKLPTDK